EKPRGRPNISNGWRMDQRLRSHQTVWIMAERLEGAVVYEPEILQPGFAAIGPLSRIKICKILKDSIDIASRFISPGMYRPVTRGGRHLIRGRRVWCGWVGMRRC